MKKDKKRRYTQTQIGEDATKYGEFVSSYFKWRTLDEQREIVDNLQEITKTEEK